MTNTTAPADKSILDSDMAFLSSILNGAFLNALLLLTPALLANLLALSDTALEANTLIMKKTIVLLGIIQISDMVVAYITVELGMPEMLVMLFFNVFVVLYGMAVLIVISVVAADFIKDSSSLDCVLNSRDLIEESEKLVQRYQKLKTGMSPLLFINCICCTVVLGKPKKIYIFLSPPLLELNVSPLFFNINIIRGEGVIGLAIKKILFLLFFFLFKNKFRLPLSSRGGEGNKALLALPFFNFCGFP